MKKGILIILINVFLCPAPVYLNCQDTPLEPTDRLSYETEKKPLIISLDTLSKPLFNHTDSSPALISPNIIHPYEGDSQSMMQGTNASSCITIHACKAETTDLKNELAIYRFFYLISAILQGYILITAVH
ncbi:hypothetical protein ACFL96_16590 [Thermoproteota archaeon]